MVRADQYGKSGTGGEFTVVAEDETGAALNQPPRLQHVKVGVERNLAERDHDAQVRQQVQLALEERTTVPQLLRSRLVTRRSAPRRRGNEHVCQSQTVAA